MSFINNIKNIKLELTKSLVPKKGSNIYDFKGSSSKDYFGTKPKRGATWYPYGDDDNTPVYLESLSDNSAIHGAILKTKSLMISGDGLLINGAKTKEESEVNFNTLTPIQKAEIKYLEENKTVGIPLQQTKDLLSDNYSIQGAFAYAVTWNKDFTKISSYKPLSTKYLRAAVPDEGEKVSKYFYYEGDFSRAREVDFETYYVYDQKDREHYDQIVFEKDSDFVYGKPSYKGALDWITINIEMGTFHKANIQNGMNPGLHFKFYTVPESEEEKQSIISDIKRNWLGAINAGRFVPTFSPSKEIAMDVDPIETSNLDKQLLNLSELSDRTILSGHQLTSPLLAGISVSGQIGGNVELKTSFELWNRMIIAKMRQKIDNSLQKHIFNVNVKGVDIKINPFNPLEGLV